MEIKIERRLGIPLIISYVGSVYIYTMLNSSHESSLLTLFMLAVIGTFGYSLYIIWQKYTSEKRVQLFIRLALFAVILHAITIPINYFFGGIIGFLVGLIIIYLFSKKYITI